MPLDIQQRQREAMTDRGLDALAIIAPENVCWTSGVAVSSQRIVRHRHAIVLVPREGDPEMIVVDMIARLEPIDDFLSELRMRKTPEEIAKLTRATRTTIATSPARPSLGRRRATSRESGRDSSTVGIWRWRGWAAERILRFVLEGGG